MAGYQVVRAELFAAVKICIQEIKDEFKKAGETIGTELVFDPVTQEDVRRNGSLNDTCCNTTSLG